MYRPDRSFFDFEPFRSSNKLYLYFAQSLVFGMVDAVSQVTSERHVHHEVQVLFVLASSAMHGGRLKAWPCESLTRLRGALA